MVPLRVRITLSRSAQQRGKRMVNRTLWRIERLNDSADGSVEALTPGLRLHVVHSPLITVAMQIGGQQRCYVVLEGCVGCTDDRCRIGCPAALLRRLIDSHKLGITLRAVAPPQGLARRPYTRGAFGWPQPASEPLESSMLMSWAVGRLAVSWRRYGSAICGSLLLLAGADGPAPRGVLHAHGWRACAAPPLLLRRWSQTALPPALPFGALWPGPLFLLLPTSTAGEAASARRSTAQGTGG
jgi:hypothetical protein